MKKIAITILIFLGSLNFYSCDILDLQPLDQLSEADVWSDPDLMQLYVNSCYNGVIHGFTSSSFMSYGDEVYCNQNNGRCWTVLIGDMDQENVESIAGEINYWGAAYSYIRKINTFFEKANSSAASEEQLKPMLGEMKFIRAFIYSNLIWRYGGVPLITKVYQLNEEYRVERNSYDECVKFIQKELNEAKALLPDKQLATGKGRASGDACQALLSRVLLYAASPLNNPSNDKAKWEAAAEAAGKLIGTRYELHNDYQMTFMVDNSEIIFARWFTQSNSTALNQWWGRAGSDGFSGTTPTQNIVNAYEMKATGKTPYMEQPDGSFVFDPTSGYDPQNPYTGRDPRFEASVLHEGSVWAGRTTEVWDGGVDSPMNIYNASETRYYFKKYITEDIPPTGSTEFPENPWIYFRYAETLLNYAEAKFEVGDENTAREYLNKVRGRNGVEMPVVNDTGDALRKRIQHERRVELAFEGHRYCDVRRWKIAEKTETQPMLRMRVIKDGDKRIYSEEVLLQRKFPERQYLIPIPRTEIEKSLNSLVQNPGY